MPIKWVLHWQPNQGSTVSTQILNEVTQCLESINGVREGRWKATLNYYKPIVRDQAAAYELPRDFLGISLAEQPSKYYFIISTQRIILEADASIQMIMEKLQSYKSRVTLYFEGSQYQLGDFRLRVGKVVPINSENLRGIVMEVALLLLCLLRSFYYVSMVFMVEYLPLSSMEKAKQVMYEFLEICQEALSKRSLPGYFMHIAPNFGEFGLSDNYSPQHTAVQYAFIVAHLIASVQAMRN
ncbi:PREDICTED: mediator of RNA polymerase II transcription subunit 20a-like isoform X1 [Tarenaya hassleriana]|uniref:mediator of RNA polymerase II transcription subunit 20a-like isoform X1 n=1 Tax=Tarenaya hassleriana TaxID=28532 RepID=UPI00053C0AC9|nr:PREDICTED: mediator of RNA polymerase II transcription subunit 20a-like isoform X1 [Tarenaya hassleriana]